MPPPDQIFVFHNARLKWPDGSRVSMFWRERDRPSTILRSEMSFLQRVCIGCILSIGGWGLIWTLLKKEQSFLSRPNLSSFSCRNKRPGCTNLITIFSSFFLFFFSFLSILSHISRSCRHKQPTPSYKKTILELKQPVSGIDFFFRFSPRLSENDYSRVKFIAKFVPTASNLRYFGLNCCVFPVKSVVHAHNQLAHDPWLLILLENTAI